MAANNQVLCIDWGTSSFRAALVDPDSQKIIKQFHSDQGCKVIFQKCQESQSNPFEYYSKILQELLNEAGFTSLMYSEIIISGMASSTIGMLELPYARLPFSLDGQDVVSKSIDVDNVGRITLVSGVSSDEDIMRGEETQLIGLSELVQLKEFVLILPGTHSKHLTIADNELIDFNTFLTGELFQLLSEQSVIRQSLRKEPWSKPYETPFKKGVEDANKLQLLQDLFKIRARDILKKGSDPGQNYFYLSGLLIGNELRSLIDSSKPKIFACDAKMEPLYHAATTQLNLSAVQFLSTDLLANSYIVGQLAVLKNR